VLEQLALIALGGAAGFSLDEMARMFSSEGQPRIDRAMLAAKAKELDRTIRRLTAMRDGLRHAAACPARSHMECPTFRRLLGAALAGAIGEKRRSSLSRVAPGSGTPGGRSPSSRRLRRRRPFS
jgi:hypothetical protein